MPDVDARVHPRQRDRRRRTRAHAQIAGPPVAERRVAGPALAHWALGRAALFANDVERAVSTLQYAVSLVGPASMWTAQLSYARARAGDRSGAMQLLADLLERERRQHVPAYDLAIAFTGIGDHDAALDQLERAFDHREMRIINLGDPELDALRAEPRYKRLLDRLRLPAR